MTVTSLVRNEVFTGKTNVINWDGYGYYAYLPAAFIYSDVTEYAFAEEHFKNYDISGDIYQLMETEAGGRFPIYNAGLAVVWAPAFLLTHAITSASGVALADGMSYPYQLMVVLMMLLFAFIGFTYLRRFLLLFFSDTVVTLVLLAIGLGTNLFYYVIEAPDMTHGYLFVLYAVFLYCFARLVDAKGWKVPQIAPAEIAAPVTKKTDPGDPKWLIYCGLLAGLMCLIRSSEIVVFALPALYGLRNLATFKRNFRRTLIMLSLALVVFSLQLIYYKAGTGSWWQNGYAGLGFDWLSPHLFEGFLGYRRGWLVYTPLMVFALLGIGWLRNGWLMPVLVFTLANCYLLFSWHIWWYGDTFGSRPVVQSYAVLALPLGALLAWILGAVAGAEQRVKGAMEERIAPKRRLILPLLLFAFIPFIALNLFQHWQYNQRILPLDFVNKTYYWHVFGKTSLDKHDLVYLDTNEKLPAGDFVSTTISSFDSTLVVPPKSRREFVNILEEKLTSDHAGQPLWLQGAIRYSYFGEAFDKWKFPGIVLEHKRGGKNLKWQQLNLPRTMTTPALDSLRFNVSLPDAREGDVVKLYFWNLCADSLVVREGKFRLLREREVRGGNLNE